MGISTILNVCSYGPMIVQTLRCPNISKVSGTQIILMQKSIKCLVVKLWRLPQRTRRQELQKFSQQDRDLKTVLQIASILLQRRLFCFYACFNWRKEKDMYTSTVKYVLTYIH